MRNKPFKHYAVCGFLTVILSLIESSSALSQNLVIQTYAVKVRQSPALLGPSVGELKHGDIVQEVSRRGNFVKVKNKKLNGWIPISSITEEKKFALKKGAKVESKDTTVVAAAALGVAPGSEITPAKSAQGRQRLRDVIDATPENDRDLHKFLSDGRFKPGRKGFLK